MFNYSTHVKKVRYEEINSGAGTPSPYSAGSSRSGLHRKICIAQPVGTARHHQTTNLLRQEWHFVWLPRTLKSWLFPFDEMDFDAVLDELLKHGYVTQFTVAGVCYGSVTDFDEHQYINPKESEKPAVYPEPSTGMTPAPSRDVPGALPAPQ
jgi:hypothetical protein